MKKHTVWTTLLACLALVLVLNVGIKESLAYFTTYVTARGGYTIELKEVETTIDEEFEPNVKKISIINTGEDRCYVRVQLFYSSLVEITFGGSSKWFEGADGYWYYTDILEPGQKTEQLIANIKYDPNDTTQSKLDYNVIVVEECAPIMADANGSIPANGPTYLGWNLEIEVVNRDEG